MNGEKLLRVLWLITAPGLMMTTSDARGAMSEVWSSVGLDASSSYGYWLPSSTSSHVASSVWYDDTVMDSAEWSSDDGGWIYAKAGMPGSVAQAESSGWTVGDPYGWGVAVAGHVPGVTVESPFVADQTWRFVWSDPWSDPPPELYLQFNWSWHVSMTTAPGEDAMGMVGVQVRYLGCGDGWAGDGKISGSGGTFDAGADFTLGPYPFCSDFEVQMEVFAYAQSTSVISPPAVVPAPAAVLLAGVGLSCAGWRLRRKTT